METSYLRSLWISLSKHRAILLTRYGQDPFDRLNEKYKNTLSLDNRIAVNQDTGESSEKSLIKMLMKNKEFLNMKSVKLLINILYHLIAFKLATPIKVNRSEIIIENSTINNTDDDEYDVSMKLKDVLVEIGTNEPELVNDNDDQINEVINDYNFDNLQIQHVYNVWVLLVKAYFSV